MDERDLSIKTQGYLKSIIESGMEPKQWEENLREALRIHGRMVKWQKDAMAKQREKKQNGN